MTTRRRLDLELVRRGLVTSRQQALSAIAHGRVLVGGTDARKPARLVGADEPVELLGPPPRFVSRGGWKLEAGLDGFGIDARDRRCLDAGSSTGGFTDCLLQRDAARVYAVDVGHGLLHERLVADPRVTVRERTNARSVTLAELDGEPVQLVVADLSFIGLVLVAPALVAVATPDADLVLLVKPQFEAGRSAVSKGRGVVRDPDVWASVLADVRKGLASAGATMIGAMVSSPTGADGNVEFLAHCTLGADAPDVGDAALRDLALDASPAGRTP